VNAHVRGRECGRRAALALSGLGIFIPKRRGREAQCDRGRPWAGAHAGLNVVQKLNGSHLADGEMTAGPRSGCGSIRRISGPARVPGGYAAYLRPQRASGRTGLISTIYGRALPWSSWLASMPDASPPGRTSPVPEWIRATWVEMPATACASATQVRAPVAEGG